MGGGVRWGRGWGEVGRNSGRRWGRGEVGRRSGSMGVRGRGGVMWEGEVLVVE